MQTPAAAGKRTRRQRVLWSIRRNWILYVFLLPTLIYLAVFHYWPLYGVQIAFKKFVPSKGIWDSAWVGLAHFKKFFSSYMFADLLRNTILLSVYQLIAAFPFPIILALLLNLDDLAGDAHAADDQNQNRYDRQHGPYRLLAIFSTSALGHVFHSISNSFTMYATKEPRVLLHPRLQKM